MKLVRLPAEAALAVLQQLVAHPRHRLWPDTLDYSGISCRGALGHRQMTDAHLAELAGHFEGQLVVFDRALGSLHGDLAVALAVR